jgi:hypothetical protein
MNRGNLKAVSIFKEKGSDFNERFTSSILTFLVSNGYIFKDSKVKKSRSAGSEQIEDERERKNDC